MCHELYDGNTSTSATEERIGATTCAMCVCYNVLQCVAVCCSASQFNAENDTWPQHVQCVHTAVCCSVLQCVAVCCSVLQGDAVHCSVLQGVAEKDTWPQHV